MDESEKFIRKNFPSLLSHNRVKSEIAELAGEWSIHMINYIHTMPRNIEFSVILQNGATVIQVMGKIHRETEKFSGVTIKQI